MLIGAAQVPQTDKPKTEMGWEVYPNHLYDALTRITREYGAPDIYITENGAAFVDEVVNGAVDDPQRVDYLRTHLAACAPRHPGRRRSCAATSAGRCSTTSSGRTATRSASASCYVDYATQRRIVKASGRFFGEVARRNAVE